MRAGRDPAVRVLGGRWKGRRLTASAAARPTSGRARQALVNLLGARVPGARVLDLYAGTGGIGIELVSRGAACAVLVEREAAPLLGALERIGARPEEVRVVAAPVDRALADLARAGERFDIVFADPPYDDDPGLGALDAVAGLLAEGGVLALQVDAGTPVPEFPGLGLRDQRAYGRNVFLFFGMR